jgi:hypothetical protein
VAYEYKGIVTEPARKGPPPSSTGTKMEFNVIKPGTNGPVKHDH